MNHKTFNQLVKDRLEICDAILVSKDKEYSSDTDRLHNFVVAGRMLNCTPIKALEGMKIKHDVSFKDIIDRMEADPLYVPSKTLIEDKLTDEINYLLLAEGLMEDRRAELAVVLTPADLKSIGLPEDMVAKVQKKDHHVECCTQCGQYHGFHGPDCDKKDEVRCLNCGRLKGKPHQNGCPGESYALVPKPKE